MLRTLALTCLTIATAVTPAAAEHLSPLELSIWNSDSFKRRFAESYLSETDIEPRVSQDERKAMQEVQKKLAEDDLEGAATALRRLRGPSASAVVDFTLANIHFQRDELDAAAAAYMVAVNKFAKFRRAWKNLGLIYIRQGKFAQAIPALTQVVQLGGHDALNYGLLGFAYGNEGNDLAAESAYRMAIMLDPETLDWKMGLGRAFFQQGRYAEAVSLTKTMIRDNPNEPSLWLLQANAYIGQGETMKAAENYELVDRLGGSTAASLSSLGDIYINQELYDLAVDAHHRASRMMETGNVARQLRAAQVMATGGALVETAALVTAIEALHGEAMDEESRKQMLKLQARVVVARGADAEQIRVLEEIVAIDPLDGEALILLGQQAGRDGRLDEAINYFKQAALIEKHEADAKVRHAEMLVNDGQYKEAVPLLKRAQELKPRESVQRYLEQVETIAKRG